MNVEKFGLSEQITKHLSSQLDKIKNCHSPMDKFVFKSELSAYILALSDVGMLDVRQYTEILLHSQSL